MKFREQAEHPSWLRLELRVLCALLCMLVVVMVLISCRRQRSHVESGKIDEGASLDSTPELGSDSSDILFEARINRGRSVHALSGQLLLTVSVGYESQKQRYASDLWIKFPEKEEEVWHDLQLAEERSWNLSQSSLWSMF